MEMKPCHIARCIQERPDVLDEAAGLRFQSNADQPHAAYTEMLDRGLAEALVHQQQLRLGLQRQNDGFSFTGAERLPLNRGKPTSLRWGVGSLLYPPKTDS